MTSGPSPAEGFVALKYSGEHDPTMNSDLHSKNSAEKTLELGNPENGVWASSFGDSEMENLKVGGGIDPVFEAKAAVLNAAFHHIGMGKYQWKLFALCGFGWAGPHKTPKNLAKEPS